MTRVKLSKKRCRDCGRKLPISEFYVKERRSHSIRYFSRCKVCYYAFIHRPGRRRRRTIGIRRTLTDGQRLERHRAWAAVDNAVYRGKLTKPGRCQRCGRRTASLDLHGHHADHKKRLEVVWLCTTCHGRET